MYIAGIELKALIDVVITKDALFSQYYYFFLLFICSIETQFINNEYLTIARYTFESCMYIKLQGLLLQTAFYVGEMLILVRVWNYFRYWVNVQ